MQAANEGKIGKQGGPKGKGQDDPQEEKLNSVLIARQMICGDPTHLDKRLLDFKSIKNQNYDKFAERIYENLHKKDFSFSDARQLFTDITHAASDDNTTPHQIATILEGFTRYWRQCQITPEELQAFFDSIDAVYPPVAKKYISIARELIVSNHKDRLEHFREEALQLINKYYRGTKTEEDKILPLVHEFDLHIAFGNGKVVEIAMRSPSANEIAYIFKLDEQVRYELVRLYIDKCVGRDSKEDLKKCETVIKVLKLDPYEYKNMISKMIGKYINYQLRTYKLYFIELVVHHDPQIIESLVSQLLREGREREAKYFILNYDVDPDHRYSAQLTKKEKESIGQIRNILLDNDRFGPTEIEVLGERPSFAKRALYMKNFGLDESNVTFVDESNILDIDFEGELSGSIGMDTENTGGVHVFDEPAMTILQIFNGRQVFIFDYFALTSNRHFHRIIVHMFRKCKIYGHDHQKEITSIQKELQLDIDEKIMQELQRSRIVDTNKFFKKVFPKETKSNLVYITEFLLNSSISKYEQCSGWRNRPLRKSQLHYASLDCILPLVLGEKLEEIEKGKKK